MEKIIRQKMFYEASAAIFENAKLLRANQTEAEVILWNILKGCKLKGFKFRRQHPMGEYIADFYCHRQKLIIELDGKYHDTKSQKQQDNYRTEFFKENNLRIIRFRNEQITDNINEVIKEIENNLLS